MDHMSAAVIITPVKSPWISAVIAAKGERSLRFCLDYRKLKSDMHGDRWPLPEVDEILHDVKGSSVFCMIDFFQGYWQIKKDETYKQEAAFV